VTILWRLALTAVAAAALLAAALAFELRRPGRPLAGPVTVTVHEGQRLAAIAEELERRDVVRFALPLVLWARLTGQDRGVRFGDYTFTTRHTPLDVLARLGGRADPPRPFTIPEGLAVHEVVALLAASGLGSEESFTCLLQDPAFLDAEALPAAGAEGYLFPDTYAFPATTPADRILRTMIRRFHEVTGGDFGRRAAALGLTEHEAVTLASLVEEETAVAEERRLVAAVFVNRLRRGIPLQSDPTVLYGRRGGDRRITRADLRRRSSHNTYAMSGLPPSPIANPGHAALRAAVDPAPVDYLYFVARGDGSHEFTSTLDAHNAAVARYRAFRKRLLREAAEKRAAR
jgi:UPF0755 protein